MKERERERERERGREREREGGREGGRVNEGEGRVRQRDPKNVKGRAVSLVTPCSMGQ